MLLLATIWFHSWNACLIEGSVHGILCATHLSYSCGPADCRYMFSRKSVRVQPSWAPNAHGCLPSLTIFRESAMSWLHVLGIWYCPCRSFFGEYQTSDFTSDFI